MYGYFSGFCMFSLVLVHSGIQSGLGDCTVVGL
jgi:hypothetical protein